jgi:hypothetical protein
MASGGGEGQRDSTLQYSLQPEYYPTVTVTVPHSHMGTRGAARRREAPFQLRHAQHRGARAEKVARVRADKDARAPRERYAGAQMKMRGRADEDSDAQARAGCGRAATISL